MASSIDNKLVAWLHCCSLGGSSKVSSLMLAPHCFASSISWLISEVRISGLSWLFRLSKVCLEPNRYTTPGSIRPARPARCTADERDILCVVSSVTPVFKLKLAARRLPLSTTILIPSMVKLVSATLVVNTTFRIP